MQPGYSGSGQDPYGQQPPYHDPYAQPQYPPPPPADPYGQPQQPPPYQDPYAPTQPVYQDPYGPTQPVYQDPYAQPTSGNPYPTSTPPGYPTAPQYPVSGFGAPQPTGNNVLAILALIFGIASIPLLCCSSGVLGILLGGAGLVLGVLGMRKAAEGLGGRGMALAGAICGGVGLVFGAVLLLLVFVFNLQGYNYSP